MRTIIYENSYKGFPLSHTDYKDEGFICEILETALSLLNHMIRQHNRVFYVDFVIKFPAGSASECQNDNELFKRLMEALALHCRRRGGDPKYLWARELSMQTGQFHYHLLLLLDGDHFWRGYSIHKKATELWQKCLNSNKGQGYVEWGTRKEHNGGIMIKKNDLDGSQIFEKCFERASYLAKVYSKGMSAANVKVFGSSRLP